MDPDLCFVAPRLRQALLRRETPVELFLDRPEYNLVTLFARPVVVHPQEWEKKNDKPRHPPLCTQGNTIPRKRRWCSESSHVPPDSLAQTEISRSRLLELPVEILYMILDLLDYNTLYGLGLTCRCLWEMAKPIIIQFFAAELGTWAGTPVICVSDRNDCGGGASYPQGLLSLEDLYELDEGFDTDEVEAIWPDEPAGIPINLFQLADARYFSTLGPNPQHTLYFAPNPKLSFREKGDKGPFPADEGQVLWCSKPSIFYPTNQEWVLRNLTTNEFVRPTAVALDKSYIRGPFIDVLGFGEVILSRTYWCMNSREVEQCQGE
ncbi:hypothetical protein MaudCBS49596_001018 [Microsporum audouinii]